MAVVGTFDGTKCSTVWIKLLQWARNEGVDFHLNSGYRSIAEQWVLYNKYKAGKGPIAAYPGTSTHNKIGWQQGVDINHKSGNPELGTKAVDNLIKWAASKGIVLRRTVSGEFWHLNATADFSKKVHHHDRKLAIWRHRLTEIRREAKIHGWSVTLRRRADHLKEAIKRARKR